MKKFSIKKNVFINAPAKIVFDALTNSDKIVQYYPLKEVKTDWKVGSEILCIGSNDGKDFIDYGKIDILIPYKKFQYRYWSNNHGTERIPENHLIICYGLAEVGNGTTLKLEHKNLKSEEMYSQMLKVWDFLLSNLKNFVENN